MKQSIVYLCKRIVTLLLSLLGIAAVVFFLVRLSGDPVALYLPLDASEAQIAAMRASLGLDRPLIQQFFSFLAGILHGDFGDSFSYGLPALEVIKMPYLQTLKLVLVALCVALAIAVPAGILAARKAGTSTDSIVSTVSLLGQSIPTFWWALMLILLFAVKLRWFPSSGVGTWKHMVLPAITLGTFEAGMYARIVRTSVLQVMGQDYIRTAKAKGLTERRVIARHVIRNAALPTITAVGMQFGSLMGGSVVTEVVFGYSGMGRLAVSAIFNRDFALTQTFVLVCAVTVALVNLIVDLAYSVLDPRVRMG
ncbi:ABC transporter permease [Oscillibacter sp. MSJ-2]|uniref:ABC transporter permease n=1 Tax=Dysosmobacter acutus TaxID=2841504 RepID=A0ABS6F7J9_9FIRM|nr:ABC transporter permease [Dysosmobacter acutus]MBU5625360.1 ABC transporter permease [Dysosmobacter acutus]